jgi:trehalose-phosphatase
MSLVMALQALADHWRAGSELLLLFDFDGTLAPIVSHPALAELPADMRRLLEQFRDLPRVRLGIISGRALADVKQMMNMDDVMYAGTHGLELEAPGIALVSPAAAAYRPFLDHAVEMIAPIASDYQGAWIEHKPLAFTVHYRGVQLAEVPCLKQRLEDALDDYSGLLMGVDASRAMEVIPDVGCNKGEAVEFILGRYPAPPALLYAGNDVNDREALEATLEFGGVAIGIGPHAPTCARWRLQDPDHLRRELTHLHAMLQA